MSSTPKTGSPHCSSRRDCTPAALSGSAAPSLEALLPALLPECAEESFPRLLNRLDAPTSGLVLAALKEAGVRFWRRAENAGRTDKRYLAVIEGQPLYDFTVGRRLDTDGRAPHAGTAYG